MDGGVWDRVAGFCFSVWCMPKFHGGEGGELGQTNRGADICQGVTSSGSGCFGHRVGWQISSFASPGAVQQGRPWLHRKNLRGTHLQLQRRRGFVNSNRTRTSTSTADGTPIWHPGASEGQDGPNPAACLEISIHLTTRPPIPV
jgi:hypothetical protein